MTQPTKRGKSNTYGGFKLARNGKNKIDVVDLKDGKVNEEWFYENYIKLRKPAVLKNAEPNSAFLRMNPADFQIDSLKETIGDAEDSPDLQVEEMVEGGFGSGKKRLKISLTEFVDRVKKGECLYMTTQYAENDPADCGDSSEDEDEDDGDFGGFNADGSDDDEEGFDGFGEVDDFDEGDLDLEAALDAEIGHSEEVMVYQPPLDRLIPDNASKLPPVISTLFEPLVPQQINLWCGRTPSSTEQLEVTRSEDDVVIGMNNGLPVANATSTGLHHDHADNLYVLVQGRKRFTLYSPDFASELYTVGDVRHVYDTGVIDYMRNANAPNWKNVRADGSCVDEGDEDEKVSDVGADVAGDPPSFCRVPPTLLHLNEIADNKTADALADYCAKTYPTFNAVKDAAVEVMLTDGDLLYLPAGWFHEVTSFGDAMHGNVHCAVNYWFVPPDGSSLKAPYSDHSYRIEFDDAYGDL